MRKLILFAGFCAIMLGIAVSCNTKSDTLNSPSGLTVGTLTGTTAELSWTAVDGADRYYVTVGGGEAIEVSTTAYEATGLTPKTTYNWKVQAAGSETLSQWAEGPAFDTLEDNVPVDLTVAGITHNSASLEWSHPDADSFEVIVGDAEAVTVDSPEYLATDLMPETPYTWRVRASKEGTWSSWAEGEEFTTAPAPDNAVEFTHFTYPYYGPGWEVSENCFLIHFYSYDFYAGNHDGWGMTFYIIPEQVDLSPERQYISIPEGTYTFSNSGAANTLYYDYTRYLDFTYLTRTTSDGWPVKPEIPVISSGTLTVSGNADKYSLTGNFTLEDGTTFIGTFNKGVPVPNPYYNPALNGFVKASFLEFGLTEDGQSRHYYLSLEDEGYANNGTGSMLILSLIAPGDYDSVIPDGTYTVQGSDSSPSGNWVAQFPYSLLSSFIEHRPNVTDALEDGTITTKRTGEGTYNITLDVITQGGVEIYTTYSGVVTSSPAPPTVPIK